MNCALDTWVKETGGLEAAGKALGLHPTVVCRYANGSRPVPPKRAVEIEEITGGRVTRSDLRPDLWPSEAA